VRCACGLPTPRGRPRAGSKKFLVSEFGPDVNLANVLPQDMETEALRVGLGVVGPRERPQ
jgi:hypothetical protein